MNLKVELNHRENLSKQIAELITNKILTGELHPGDKLPTEIELTNQLDISRNSVREAIKMLTFMGILEIRRGEGTFVCKKMRSSVINPLLMSLMFEERTAKELVELRLLLDISVIPKIIYNLTDEDIKSLKNANELMYLESKKPNYDKDYLLELDINFHRVYHSLAKNRLLLKIYETVYMLFATSVKESLNKDPEYAYISHKDLIKAIEEKDSERIENNLRESLSEWVKVLETQETKVKSTGKKL